MPLRAYINNDEIISIDQDEKQWDDLKKRLKSKECVLTLSCCRQVGFLRKSSKGLKHFVHSKVDSICDWNPESPEHLRAKIEIIEACNENGWKAIPEFSEKNWRADVLAIQNDKRIAFEVQWSKQSFADTKLRQERYRESNVRGCWFFRAAPKELRVYGEHLKADKDIPAFKIFKDENSNIFTKLKHKQLPIKDFVASLLKRQLKFCKHVRLKPKQEVTIIFFEKSCWKCHKSQHLWTVEQNLVTVCNEDFYVMGSMWNSDDIDKSPKIYEAVKQFLQTEKGKNLKIGQLKKRYSKTVHHTYLSHGCFYCDSIFGDWFLNTEKAYGQNDPNLITHKVAIEFETVTEEGAHWCYSDSGQHCE
jgi:hypothetical protein